MYPGYIMMAIFSLFASKLLANYVVVQRWILPRDVIKEGPLRTVTSCIMECSRMDKCATVGFRKNPDLVKNDKCLFVKMLRKKNKNGTRIKIFALVEERTAMEDEKKERIALEKQQSCPVDGPGFHSSGPYSDKISPLFIIVNGGYGNWSNFTVCTKTCGSGVQYRNRSCDSPTPKYGGRNCTILGNATEVRSCNQQPCPVDGIYGPWSVFGRCNQTCGGGSQWRNRSCDSPPFHGGRNCTSIGNATEVRKCNTDICPCQNISRFIGVWKVSDPKYDAFSIEQTAAGCTGFDGCGRWPRYRSDSVNLLPTSEGWYRAKRYDGNKWFYFRQVRDRLTVVYFNRWYGGYYKGKKYYANKAVGKPNSNTNIPELLGLWQVFWQNKGKNRNKYDIASDGTLTITASTKKSFQIKASDNKDGKYAQTDGWCKGYNNDVADKTVIYLRVVDDNVGIIEVNTLNENGQTSERFGWK